MRDTQGSASRRNPGLNDEIPLGFPVGIPPRLFRGVLGWRAPIIPLGFWVECPHNFVKIPGGNNPKNYVGIFGGNGRLSTRRFPFGARRRRANHLAQWLPRQRLPWVWVMEEIATLKALHQWTTSITSIPHAFARASECAVLANAFIISRLVDNARALDATPLGLETVLNARYPG
jgi:hypothetical protein